VPIRGNDSVPYLTQQIIPYIGNKRRLLPLIKRAIQCADPSGERGGRFLDLFSGSGVVSRLAKYLGYEVYANDWEYYSYLLIYAYICIDNSELKEMYGLWGGIEGILSHLNGLPLPAPQDQYISRYFCPKDDMRPDYRTERLFYTRINGLFIDKVRNEIDKLYPENEITKSEKLHKEKALRAFEDLIESISAKSVLISYSTEGTILFDRMISICADRGKVSLVTDEYVKYRGGRQSLYHHNNNVEFVIIVDTTRRSVRRDLRRIDESILYRNLLLQAKKCYSRKRFEEYFRVTPVTSSIGFKEGGRDVTTGTRGLYRIMRGASNPQ